ncbi:DEAD/DEAH box helicase [Exiguobacterium acetylicum]|uniref:DEAD/DEAH box helicase n=1 Tax=Exiguobacterium acetylicum TaxID=41170 RepID=UPI0024B6F92E|nr:DEAD/DEAH box helicase [Exiguobacterium acetylicum]UKS54848.1 DEAD/DEAH box helicase [Exiguobacterium acetylicum]
MQAKQTLVAFLEELKQDRSFMERITYMKTMEATAGRYVDFPEQLPERLRQALRTRGINQLYRHQGLAYERVQAGESTVIVTPTASGKTYCFNLPVLSHLLEHPNARALYLYPTKALAQDQNSELLELIDQLEAPIRCFTYDGDTSPTIRTKVRKAGNIVITNPDMLHSGILPHHTKWIELFENLKYIVIDELHTYRGVFGSHVANVIRRLRRICRYYGSDPVFIMTSATIANPKELAERLTEKSVGLIDDNGAPTGRKHFLVYQPPIVNAQLGIRRSATLETKQLAMRFIKKKFQTIVFARSRVRVEVLLTYLRSIYPHELGPRSIEGYRGGYLPSERRDIERRLRQGEITGIVSTNALELGVDIGQLQVCIMNGYPGTIASLWQQAGRAGRRQDDALIILVASSGMLDQYVAERPELFLNQSPEAARLDPDNLIIAVDHVKCAAFELPFTKGESFGSLETEDILEYLVEERVLHERGDRFYWMNDAFPAHGISLRSSDQENVIIVDQTEVPNRVIGEMDTFSAMTLLHDEAIYLHGADQYQVEHLDFEEKKAFVRAVDVDYYTDANFSVDLSVLEEDERYADGEYSVARGDVSVRGMATMFKKIKFGTHENIGSGPIHLPEREIHTTGVWFTLPDHARSSTELEQVLEGVANSLRRVAPLYLMCDASDVFVVPQVKATHTQQPTVYLYDRYPGGVGLAQSIYKQRGVMLRAARDSIVTCPCQDGCPACIGMVGVADEKERTIQLLAEMEKELS